MTEKKLNQAIKRQRRVRKNLLALSIRPRLVVTRSNKQISGQVIDRSGKVVCAYSSQSLKKSKANKAEIATEVGTKLGQLVKEHKIKELVFDRGRYHYHGRVKALAEAVRKSGINF